MRFLCDFAGRIFTFVIPTSFLFLFVFSVSVYFLLWRCRFLGIGFIGFGWEDGDATEFEKKNTLEANWEKEDLTDLLPLLACSFLKYSHWAVFSVDKWGIGGSSCPEKKMVKNEVFTLAKQMPDRWLRGEKIGVEKFRFNGRKRKHFWLHVFASSDH